MSHRFSCKLWKKPKHTNGWLENLLLLISSPKFLNRTNVLLLFNTNGAYNSHSGVLKKKCLLS